VLVCVNRWKALYNVHHTSPLPVIYDQLHCGVNAHSLNDCNITVMKSRQDVTTCDAASEAAAVSCIPRVPHHHNGNSYIPSHHISCF